MKTKTKKKKSASSGGKQMSSEERKKALQRRTVVTPMGRLSFPALFEPAEFEDGSEPKYQATLLFTKKTDISALKKAAESAAFQQWGTKDPKKLPKGKKGVPFAWPFNDGNDKEDLEGYKNTIYVRASSKRRPGVVDREKQPITAEDDNIKAGDYVRAGLTAFAYGGPGTKYNPGVSFALNNVQKLKDGEPFGGGISAEEQFDEWNDDEEMGGDEEE